MHEQELEQAKRKYALEAEETLLAERSERIRRIDEERVKFSALKTVLTNRRKTLEDANHAHEIVATVAKLTEKIEKGKSFDREMYVLRKIATQDEVLHTMLSNSQKTLELLASKDVPTLPQLRDTLEKQVKRDARRVFLVPREGSGMIAHAISSLASLMKVEENESVKKPDTEDARVNMSLEAAITKAEKLLRDDGNCGDAARTLLTACKDSKAGEVVESWTTQAMEREEIDFILRALKAHAMVKSAGIYSRK